MSSRARANYDRFLSYNVNVGYKLTEKPSVWVKDDDEGFKKGEVQSNTGGKMKVKFGDGSSVMVNEKDTEPANPSKFDGVKDCSDLSHLNNATVLHNLRVRYAEDLIHTYSGLFLVVVNPYKWIPIYTDEIIQMYQGKRRNEVHPHVFAVADEAYRAMMNGKRNQSILITGESGAGKTENTKKVIQYLATIAGKASQGGKLEEQILQANPMLEAFGNAKTNKNDNSSRFGKFIRIQFNSGGIICGTTIQVYLLEKSRVVVQGRGERSFHIFYQLLAGADSVQRKEFYLQKATEYGFFTDHNSIVLRSMDDGAEWGHTLKAMDVIGLSEEEQNSIFRMTAGIMQCGNIKYGSSYGGEGAKIENPEVLDKIADLWSIDREQFEKALVKPKVTAGREVVEKHLNKAEAAYAREAMCKSLYERAFLWIVKKLNRVLASPTEANFIGVLDIAGFEIFENNTFEQLCINYTNEKLQQFFNNHMFKLEQEEYAREKITWKYIDFGIDSVQTIDLIDKKDSSIIALLDEETIFPRATDESLIQKLHTLAKKHVKYSEVQFKKLNFQIQHYAGDVVYDVKDWITKNKDPLQADIAKAVAGSKNSFFSALFTDPDLDPRERLAQQKAQAAAAAGKKKAVTTSGATFLTVASAYKDQLNDLMDTLRATEPNFIRCLIPNLQKKQQSLNADLILEQLACNGVLEGIRISRKGYPNRVSYPEFVKRYYLLHPTLKRNEAETKEATKKIMANLDKEIEKAFAEGDHPKPLYQFGLTKIFFRHGVLAKIEETRERKLGQMVIAIQAGARGWLGRSAMRKMGSQTAAARTLQKNIATWIKFRKWNWWQLFVKAKPLLNKVGFDVIVKELEDRLEQLEKEIEEAKADRAKLQKEYEEKKDHLLTLREDVASLNGRVGRLESESEELKNETSDLNKSIAELEDKLASASKSRSATDKDLQDTESRLDDARSGVKKEEGLVSDLEKLKKEQLATLEENKEKESDLKDSNSKLSAKEAALNHDLSSTRDDLESADSKSKDTKRTLDKLQADKADAEDEISSTKSAVNKASSAVTETKARVADTEDDLSSCRSKTKGVKAEVATLEEDLSDLNKKLDNVERELADLEKKNKRLQGEVADTQADAEDEKSSVANATKKNKAIQAEVDDLEIKKASLEKTRDNLENDKRSTGNAVNDKKSELSDLEDQEKRLKKQLSEANSKLQQAKDDLDSAENTIEQTEKANKKLTNDIASARDNLESTKAENERKAESKFKAALKNVEDQVADVQSGVTRETSEASRLKQELNDVENDLDAAERAVSAAATKLKSIKGELGDTRADADDEADGRDVAERNAKKAQSDLAELKRTVADLDAEQINLESKLKRVVADAQGGISKEAEAKMAQDQSRMQELTDQLNAQLDWVRARLADLEGENKKLSQMSRTRQGGMEEEENDDDLNEDQRRAKAKRALDDSKLPAWVLTQKKTFTRWCNSFLVDRMIRINDFNDDFTDGVKLCNLVEVISKKSLRFNKNPRMKAQELENVGAALKFLQAQGIKVVGIGPEDIVDPKIKLILGLIWTIILRYQIQSGDDSGSPKAQLLKWIKEKIPEYNIKNFVKDWSDGKAICALVNVLNPGHMSLPGDFSTPMRNCQTAFKIATGPMKIPHLLDPEDMVNEADELSNMTFLSYFRTWEIENAKRVEMQKIEDAKNDINAARGELSAIQKELDLVNSEMFALRNLGRMGTVVSSKNLLSK